MENYRKLKEAGIGTYILFQETYNKEQYEKLHPTGPKSNYAYHTEAMDRAMQGGIDDVGCGVLFGLNLYRYDFVGLLMHAETSGSRLWGGTSYDQCSRLRNADDIDVSDFSNAISDELFQKIVAILRIAVPYTGTHRLYARIAAHPRNGHQVWSVPDQRRFPHQCGRLCGRGPHGGRTLPNLKSATTGHWMKWSTGC
ncbi:hypothetical protein [Anaeromassilibacillus sp. SJQ-1]|uniref:hypothetical protein n=1 Tax=Anaeromassilibacillus sp. SJQ-1 TaxID=3375419 RepID=UPI003988B9D1